MVLLPDDHGGAIFLSLAIFFQDTRPASTRSGSRVAVVTVVGVGRRVCEVEVVGAERLFEFLPPEL